jgi:hypothetical protein
MDQSFKTLYWEMTSRSEDYLARLMTLLCLLEFIPTALGVCLGQLAKVLLGLLMTVLCLLELVPIALSVCLGQLFQILLGLVLWIMTSQSGNYLAMLMAILCLLECVPTTLGATLEQSSFPDISFQLFSTFIENNFNENISLATVLTMLFTLTNNPDALNLHARQQLKIFKEERSNQVSGWIKILAYALEEKLGKAANELFPKSEEHKLQLPDDQTAKAIGEKLDKMIKLLEMCPYDKYGTFQHKLKPVSEKSIEPALVICPPVMECETSTCNPRSLLQGTDNRDVPKVTFIQGTKIYDHVFVVCGSCPQCKTKYYADHESSLRAGSSNIWSRYYLNSAKYLKIGQQLWVDRTFSKAVLNGSYSFHGSSSAFAEFWSDSFWATQATSSKKITRRQIWQAFIQESVRKIADSSGHNLELPDGLNITQVTKQAFAILGDEGVIGSANGHSCSGCTQPFKKVADKITEEDPAALLGVDENSVVPPLIGEDADLAVRDAALARFNANNAMDVDEDNVMKAPRTMIVMDGIVVGPPHCAYAECTAELANSRQGVFCIQHELMRGALCRMRDCQNPKADDSHVCMEHQGRWRGFLLRYGRQSMLGIRRIIRRTEEEKLPWLPNREPHAHQAHDEPGHGQERQQDSYFKAPRFYCVETICAPCGVVIAWTKFAKAESPTNILGWLDSVYPNAAQRPDYICIDKACIVLRTAVVNGSWEVWSRTTRFIVDSYHYINHRTTDYLCRTWCNPAPLNGSQPNLIAVEYDAQGQPHYKRAFNTQVGYLL